MALPPLELFSLERKGRPVAGWPFRLQCLFRRKGYFSSLAERIVQFVSDATRFHNSLFRVNDFLAAFVHYEVREGFIYQCHGETLVN